MKDPKISHAIADISYKGDFETLSQLTIFIGDEHDSKIARQS